MEEIIQKLYGIETEAVKIMDETTQRKLRLFEGMERSKQALNKRLKDENNKRLEEYANEQKRHFEQKLLQYKDYIVNMERITDETYKEHHNGIVNRLLYEILNDDDD